MPAAKATNLDARPRHLPRTLGTRTCGDILAISLPLLASTGGGPLKRAHHARLLLTLHFVRLVAIPGTIVYLPPCQWQISRVWACIRAPVPAGRSSAWVAHLAAGRSTSTSTGTRSDLASTGAVMAGGDASQHSHGVFRLLLSVLPATIRRAAAALRRPWHRVAVQHHQPATGWHGRQAVIAVMAGMMDSLRRSFDRQ
jgi:hypothetical protein